MSSRELSQTAGSALDKWSFWDRMAFIFLAPVFAGAMFGMARDTVQHDPTWALAGLFCMAVGYVARWLKPSGFWAVRKAGGVKVSVQAKTQAAADEAADQLIRPFSSAKPIA